MKNLLICLVLATCFIVKGSSETLKCYECDDCDVLDDSQLKICSPPDLIKPPPPLKPSSLATESTESTDEATSITITSSMETVSTISSNPTQIVTDLPTSSIETVTETSKTEQTTLKTELTEPPITNQTKPTTVSSSFGSEVPTNNIPSVPSETLGQITDEPNLPITGSSENKNPTNGIPETSKPSITESSGFFNGINTNPVEEIPSSIVFTPVGTTDSPEIFQPITDRPETSATITNMPPSYQAPSESFQPEEVYSIVPESLQSNQPYPIFNRVPREVRSSRSSSSYHCYSINMLDGEKKKVKKGCIDVPEDKVACDVLKHEFGKSVDKCKICSEDKCNSSSSLKFSLISLAIVIVISFYY